MGHTVFVPNGGGFSLVPPARRRLGVVYLAAGVRLCLVRRRLLGADGVLTGVSVLRRGELLLLASILPYNAPQRADS
jgi:hypothetical protein